MVEPAPRFQDGDHVRVRRAHAHGHTRAPRYLRGRTGQVSLVHGAFRDPELLAYGGDGLPKRPLYQVCFAQREVWETYTGAPTDTVCADIYEHWLEAT